MRSPDDVLISGEISHWDRTVCDEMKRVYEIDTDANLIRAALYKLAVFGLPAGSVPTSTFALRVAGSTGRMPASRVKPTVSSPAAAAGPHQSASPTPPSPAPPHDPS